MKNLFFLLCLTRLVHQAGAQETRQFRISITDPNDNNAVFASGAAWLTGNHFVYSAYSPWCFTAIAIRGPAGPGNNGPLIHADSTLGCSADSGSRLGGEFSLTAAQIEELNSGLWYAEIGGDRGQILFDGACRFLPTNEVQFASFVDGWNPTNRRPRYLRYGRATFGLTGDNFSYEIRLPAQGAPYTAYVFEPTALRHYSILVADLGTVECLQFGDTGLPPVPADLELLPACVFRGAFCVPSGLKSHLLGGQWVLGISGFSGYSAWASIYPVDTDQDGVPDFRDTCLATPSGAVVNAEGCSIEQLAPCAGPWRNHGEYVHRVKAVSADFVKAGLITKVQRRVVLIQAAQSGCGRH